MASDDLLAWTVLDDVFAAAQVFLDPLLAGDAAVATWNPATTRWETSR